MRLLAVLALLCAACNQVFGLDPPALVDAGADGDAAAACGDPAGSPDEDGDGRRDECDNCPHVAQVTSEDWKDNDGDGIGLACDPHKGDRDRVVAFYTFAEPVPSDVLHPVVDAAAGSWQFIDGDLVATGTTPGTDMIARLDVALAAVTVDVAFTLPTTLPQLEQAQARALGVWADVEPPPGGAGYDPTVPPGALLELFEANGTQLLQSAHLADTSNGASDPSAPSPELFTAGRRYRLVLTCEADAMCTGTVAHLGAVLDTLTLYIVGRVGSVGLRSAAVDARFHHLMVYTRAP